MLTKEKIQKVIDELPKEGAIDIDALIQKMFILQEIEEAEENYKNGEVLTSNELKKEIDSWQE